MIFLADTRHKMVTFWSWKRRLLKYLDNDFRFARRVVQWDVSYIAHDDFEAKLTISTEHVIGEMIGISHQIDWNNESNKPIYIYGNT